MRTMLHGLPAARAWPVRQSCQLLMLHPFVLSIHSPGSGQMQEPTLPAGGPPQHKLGSTGIRGAGECAAADQQAACG